jgi:serine/threonine-protein kinase
MIRRHSAPMALTSPQQFLAALRGSCIFSAAQLAELESEQRLLDQDVAEWVPQLVERGWLTAYQAEQVLSGCGDGLILGQYCILDRLGEGGMAQVYKAEHILMKRSVAMKIIAAKPWSDPERGYAASENGGEFEEAITPGGPGAVGDQSSPDAIDRFHHEVQIAARLDHPNIVRAYDAAEARGRFFLVMEFVDGVDLGARVVRDGPLPVAVACEIIRQAALGLQYAHEHDLIHRDIKPSNLLVTKTGVVKILDLGLARLTGAIHRELAGPPNASDASGLAGTPDYMAPETAQDHRCADIRSDLYSLGCTFYYLLTGQAPFPGGGWPEKLLRHQLDSAPSAVVLRPDVPEEIAALLQRLMDKDPAGRPQTPAELATELEAWLAAHGTSVDPVPAVLTATADGTSTPTVNLGAGPPTPPRTPILQTLTSESSSAAASHPRKRGSLSWPLGFAASALIGLIAAILLRSSADRLGAPSDRTDLAIKPAAAIASVEPIAFDVEGSPERFPTLNAAISAAPNSGVITVHGNGPISIKPQRLHGKALTLRSTESTHPRLTLMLEGDSEPWQALFATDQPLQLDGLELVCEQSSSSHIGTAHLVYVEKAPLTLKNCVIRAPHGQACVVCRECAQVHLENCQITADSLAMCIETGAGETDVRLQKTRFHIESPRGAGLSAWASEAGRSGTLQLHVDDCSIQTGRAFAFGILPKQITVTSKNNQVTFREALVSFSNSPEHNEWRRVTRWEDVGNTYETRGTGWLQVNGTSADVHDLQGWQKVWSTP